MKSCKAQEKPTLLKQAFDIKTNKLKTDTN